MKKGLLLLIVLFAFKISSAQLFTKKKVLNHQVIDKKTLNWGYYFGINNLDFKFDYKSPVKKDISIGNSIGFNVGLVGNLRINDFIDLRLEPGLIINTRKLAFNEADFINRPNFKKSNLEREVKSTYVYVPLLVKFSTKRINNFKPFVLAGLSFASNLGSNEDSPDDNSNGTFRLKSNTNFYEIGFGIDFYLNYFKFTPTIRGVFGLSDELVPDADPNSPWTSNISSMQTRGVFINFTFQ